MSIAAKMSAYWEKGTFNDLYIQIQAVQKQIATHRKDFQPDQAREHLLAQVEKLRGIQKSLLAADAVIEEANKIEGLHKTKVQWDFVQFIKRVEQLKMDIQSVYRNALYPFLLSVRNAEQEWNPNHIVCQVYDYIAWWRVIDAEAEINKALPKS